jgi:hypothetical protein
MNGAARSRARRLLAALGKGAALLLVFVVALVVAALAHVDTPRGRRLVAGGVTAALDGQFRGRFVLDRVGRIGLDGVSGIDARLVSDTGDVLVSAQGLAARADVLTLARRAVGFVAGTQPTLVVALDEVSADHLAVDVGRDSSSVPKLLRALESPKPPVPSSSPGPELRLGHVRVHHAWIFGEPPRRGRRRRRGRSARRSPRALGRRARGGRRRALRRGPWRDPRAARDPPSDGAGALGRGAADPRRPRRARPDRVGHEPLRGRGDARREAPACARASPRPRAECSGRSFRRSGHAATSPPRSRPKVTPRTCAHT